MRKLRELHGEELWKNDAPGLKGFNVSMDRDTWKPLENEMRDLGII